MPGELVTCDWCNGAGFYIAHYQDRYQGRVPYERGCEQCGGTGQHHPQMALPKKRKKK